MVDRGQVVKDDGVNTLYFDFETTFGTDIKNYGSWAFAEREAPTWVAWAVNNGPIKSGKCERGKLHGRFLEELKEADVLVAHNITFDLSVLANNWNSADFTKHALMKQLDCTQAACRALKFPAALGNACRHFGLSAKGAMPEGLDDLFAGSDDDWLTYVKQDVACLRELYNITYGQLHSSEKADIDISNKINLTGVLIDRPGLEVALVDGADKILQMASQFSEITGLGYQQTVKLAGWFSMEGGVGKDKLRAALETGRLDEIQEKAARLRLELVDGEHVKLAAIDRQLGTGGDRLRNTLNYAGTITGRWSGKIGHPQNCKRSGIARTLFKAGAGQKLYVSDYAQVEMRVALWLAGSFAEVKQLHTADLYMDVAREVFGDGAGKDERHKAKAAMLGITYGSGVKRMAVTLNMPVGKVKPIYDRLYNGAMAKVVTYSQRLFAHVGCVVRDIMPSGMKIGGVEVTKNGHDVTLRLPRGGREIHYRNTRQEETGWAYGLPSAQGGVVLHRGKIYEHVVSRFCRDLLASALRNMVDAGLQHRSGVLANSRCWPVIHVHDEVVCEVPESADKTEMGELDRLMLPVVPISNLPLAVESRYCSHWHMPVTLST